MTRTGITEVGDRTQRERGGEETDHVTVVEEMIQIATNPRREETAVSSRRTAAKNRTEPAGEVMYGQAESPYTQENDVLYSFTKR